MPAVLIVAHAPLASALKAVAAHCYADSGPRVEALDVPPVATPDEVQAQARALMAAAPPTDWLVLTDVFGATPCNAVQALAGPQVRVLAGVNVPMLWRTLCYADEPLDALVARALSGAGQGVMQVSPTRPQNQHPDALGRGTRSDQVDHQHQQ